MAGNSNSSEIDWERLARLEINHRRIGILEVLSLDGGRTLSVKEIAAELQCSTSDAHYHVSKLAPRGLIRFVVALPVRGALEHFYCLAGHSGDDLAERLGLPRRAMLSEDER